jgi:hypothetical protein
VRSADCNDGVRTLMNRGCTAIKIVDDDESIFSAEYMAKNMELLQKQKDELGVEDKYDKVPTTPPRLTPCLTLTLARAPSTVSRLVTYLASDG